MAIRKSTRRAKKARNPRTEPVFHDARKGLMVNMRAQFPESAGEKIICAKSIIQAVVAAQDALAGENYDIRWPLDIAVTLLEQASSQVQS